MLTDWNIISLFSSLLCFGSFVWAIKRFFIAPADKRETAPGMRAISLIGGLCMALQVTAILITEHTDWKVALVGIILYAVSLILFWWSVATTYRSRLTLAFSSDVPQRFLKTGPYHLVRHPFYSSYLLFGIAGLVVSRQWWLAPTVIVMVMLYWRAAKYEEQKFLTSSFAFDYSEYKVSTGMFIPNLLNLITGSAPRKSYNIN